MVKNQDTNEEIEFIKDDESPIGADLADKLKKAKEKLKIAEKEKQDYLANWQKERADFLNYKKEEEKTKSKISQYAKTSFAEELLPVLDSYDIAFADKSAWEKVDKNWRMGVEYIHAQLLKVLSENGIEEIKTKEGDMLDHSIHEPMESVITEDESKDQTVAKLLQKGYRTKDGVLRPAKVNIFSLK